MPAPTSAFGNLQLRPLMLPNPGQAAQLRDSTAAGWGACRRAAASPGDHSPLPGWGPPRSPRGDPPLPTEATPRGCRAGGRAAPRGRTAKPAPALASILIACDEMMAAGPTSAFQNTPLAARPPRGTSVFQRVHGEAVRPPLPLPPPPPVFGSASMSANVFCFDQQRCAGTGADGNRKQIEPGWKCLKRNTQRAGAKKHGLACPVLHEAAFRPRPWGHQTRTEAVKAPPPHPGPLAPAEARKGRSVFIFVALAPPLPSNPPFTMCLTQSKSSTLVPAGWG